MEMIATEMPAAMMLYSIAVVADSSSRKRLTSANIVLLPSSVNSPAMRGNLKATCCQDFSANKPALAAMRSETSVPV
jgi:hypothetical protein